VSKGMMKAKSNSKKEIRFKTLTLPALLYDLFLSVVISLIAIAVDYNYYFENKGYVNIIISIFIVFWFSLGIIYNENYPNKGYEIIIPIFLVMWVIMIIYLLMLSIKDIEGILMLEIFKFPLPVIIALFKIRK